MAVSRAGIVPDGVVRNETTRINGITFKESPEENCQARHRALHNSVRTALGEAKIVALAARNSIGRALAVRVAGWFFPQSVDSNVSFRGSSSSVVVLLPLSLAETSL